MEGVSVDDVRRYFNYNPETGLITWRVRPSRNRQIGSVAGTLHPDGYRILRLHYKPLMAHRVAWALHHGQWPENEIDHINGIRGDNRICNLRDVVREVNTQNLRHARSDNACGMLGVGRHSGRWRARLTVSGKLRSLGLFDTAEAAHAAYVKAKRELHAGNTL